MISTSIGQRLRVMTKEQLEKIKNEINRAYLFLLSKSDIDPQVIELIKLATLSDAQKRFDANEPW
jgi:hypothetical protein